MDGLPFFRWWEDPFDDEPKEASLSRGAVKPVPAIPDPPRGAPERFAYAIKRRGVVARIKDLISRTGGG